MVNQEVELKLALAFQGTHATLCDRPNRSVGGFIDRFEVIRFIGGFDATGPEDRFVAGLHHDLDFFADTTLRRFGTDLFKF